MIDLAFAYIHPSLDLGLGLGNPSISSESAPSPSPPFATFHPRQTTSLTPSSSGIALLSPSSDIYLSTSTACLKPCVRAQGEGTPSPPAAVAGGQPAAYASYCGLGFAGGERDRTRAFRSLFARQQRSTSSSSSSGAINSWAYLPRIRKAGLDEGEKEEEEEGESHAVAVVYPANGSIEPRWMVAYVSAGSGERVRWDCSTLVEEEEGSSKVALWNAEERCAVLPVDDEEQGGGRVVVSLATGNAPLLKTLQIVRLVEMQQHAGPSVVFGILSSLDKGTFQEDQGWSYEPEKIDEEEYYVDEQVIAPSATPTSTSTPKPIPDDARRASEPTRDAPPSADSGVTESTTSPSSSEQGDETSVTSIEEVLDDDVPRTSSCLKGQGEEERDGFVFVAPVTREEGEAPMTGDLHAAERGSHAAEGASSGSKPVRNDDDATVDPTNEQERPAQPTAVVAPRKSFFRFLWITLGLFQSLYFRAISWFRSCWGGPKGADVGGAAGADELVSGEAEGNENEQTPLLNKVRFPLYSF
ncbi:hypothetical protein QFC22_001185 [Naganishia vaughanmartiniae]|uniref:Uncharacterized protein n=1 Tax=Naganishia vaughanmartiniae TaxID=1424756 RepID=A0ACC2XL92_9TREE|nr:hypothetical protein QFC22_001185 [Naganishia vaughanmartiniae]